MMYTLKEKCVVVLLLQFILGHDSFGHAQEQQQYNPVISPLPVAHFASPWEHKLREIILKLVTASLLDANVPHERPLDASFYGGPFAAYSNDDVNVVLSHGNVYRLLNGHWMLCQDGCVDCEPCATQRNPSFKWILRWNKQLPASDPPRHDLQLTIMPQTDDHFDPNNFWPNSYVYVKAWGNQEPVSISRMQYDNNQENSFSSLENSYSKQHHQDPRQLKERDTIASLNGRQENNHITVQEDMSTEKPAKEVSPKQKHRHKIRSRGRPRRVEKTKVEETNQLTPKLILGIDQQGQKIMNQINNLVHVVPADHPLISALPVNPLTLNYSISSQFTADQATYLNNINPEHERETYPRAFRRVLDFLNTHKRSIENLLESPTTNTDPFSFIVTTDSSIIRNEILNRTKILQGTSKTFTDSSKSIAMNEE